MRLELRGHHVDVTPGLRRFVEEKLAKLERLLNDRAVSAQASADGREAPPSSPTSRCTRAASSSCTGWAIPATGKPSLTQAIAKISHQAQKLKTSARRTSATTSRRRRWSRSEPIGQRATAQRSRPAAHARAARGRVPRDPAARHGKRSSRCRSSRRRARSRGRRRRRRRLPERQTRGDQRVVPAA